MACDTIKIETLDADEVVSIVTAGPQGPSGAEAATLTTTGDLLYRAALANARLPIGSEGQVLKVSSGLPAWGNESGAVTEVNGQTGAVVLDAADVGAAPASGIDPTAITGTAVVDSDPRLTDSRTPSSHASSHAVTGSDPLAPSDIGAQSIFVTEDLGTITANATLTAARAKIYTVVVNVFTNPYVELPTSNIQAGDVVQIRFTSFTGRQLEIRRNGTIYGDAIRSGEQATYIAASTSASSWEESPNNRLKISTGSGFPVITVGSGYVGAGTFGTSAGTFCQGNDARLSDARTPTSHTHAASDITSGSFGNISHDGKLGSVSGLPVVTTTAGAVTTLALGTAGQVLTVNGTADGVEFAAASGGGFGEVRFDASGSYTYTGQAAAGASESSAVWFIRRSEFSSAGSYVSTTTANNVEWDDRLTTSYS